MNLKKAAEDRIALSYRLSENPDEESKYIKIYIKFSPVN